MRRREFITFLVGAASCGPTRRNEFLPRSIPITAISLLSLRDMVCSFVFGAPASLLRWQGWSTAGPSH
jgi:hypothetical protein